MIEDIFLTYANHSLRDNPEKLYEVFEKFKSLNEVAPYCESAIWQIIKHFTNFIKGGFQPLSDDFCQDDLEPDKHCEALDAVVFKDIREATKRIDELKRGLDELKIDDELRNTRREYEDSKRAAKVFGYKVADYSPQYLRIAYKGVYGYRGGYCEAICPGRENRRRVVGEDKFTGQDRIHCYECDQFVFRYMLKGLVRGREYREIPDMEHYIVSAGRNFHKMGCIGETSLDSPFKEQVILRVVYRHPFGPLIREITSFSSIFFGSIVAYSLAEWLLNNDRRKLRLCRECNRYYTSSYVPSPRKPSKYCSDKCRLSFHNRKRIESGEARRYKRERRAAGLDQ